MNNDEQQQLIERLTKEFISRWERSRRNEASNANDRHPANEQDDVQRIKELALQLSRISLPDVGSESASTGKATRSSADGSTGLPRSYMNNQFLSQFLRANETVHRYEDRELLDAAAEKIPMSRIFEEAEARMGDHPDDGLDDIVVRRLLHWFKNEFFTWVNEPPCGSCNGKTFAIGHAAPSLQELLHGAGIVEAYQCTNGCRIQTRFPRYNLPKILLETRRGRCGEWANCFTLCCRAMGFKARYVHDTTDHVWTEVWSDHKQRWIHCDSCEEAYDQPLLYSTGWGKSLSYCVAFSVEEAVDVTRRYTVDYETVVLKRRQSIDETAFAQFLRTISEKNLQQLGLSPTQVEEIRQRQALEQEELATLQKQTRKEETVGRESGSLDWKKARGETRD